MSEQKTEEQVKKSATCLIFCRKNTFIIGIAAAFLIMGAFLYFKEQLVFSNFLKLPMSKEEAKIKAENFIKNNLIQPGMDFSIKEVTEESDLYKITVVVDQQEFFSYMTKDAKKFFLEAIDMEKIAENKQAQQQSIKTSVENKKNIPEVEVFVMSYCPFGTQIQKGIIPALETLGNKIKFSFKFVDYIMHPKEGEIEENLRQYCVQKEDPSKLLQYLNCFLKKGGEAEAKNCLRTVGINVEKIENCSKLTDAQFEISKKRNDKSAWNGGQFPPFDVHKEDNKKYSIKGSPTLVINGETISSERDSQSLLSAICSGFVEKPAECDKKISAKIPSAGFGEGETAGASQEASCGS